jgi:CheY-like chemotaxis protein
LVGRRAGRVLVVDDSEMNRLVALGMLEALGYEADAVDGGEAALAAIGHTAYAAILMDREMPRMDGVEATAEIRQHTAGERHIPVIAMTANALAGAREECLAGGMDDYITKPVRLEALEAVLGRWVPAAAEADPALPDGSAPPAEKATTEHHQPLAPAINPSALNALRELQPPGGPDLVARLVELFLTESPMQLRALREAIARGDAETLRRVAHKLKGNADNFGAHEVRTLCARLEQLGRDGRTQGADEILEALQSAYARVEAAFEALPVGGKV